MARRENRGTNAAIGNLMEWAQRPEWAARFADVLAHHIGDIGDEFGITSEDELMEALGDAADMLFGAAFEDFLTRPYEEREETIVDEYLRRRGFKESVPGRRYLEGLRDSAVSLYEVLESVPDSHLVLRDLVRGLDPVRVEERTGSRSIVKWDCLACRVVPLNQKLVLSGAILPLERDQANELLERLTAAIGNADAEKELAGHPEFVGVDMADIVLSVSAPMFTQTWLEHVLERRQAPLAQIRNTDGEDLVFVTTRWPVAGEAAEIARRLDAATDRHIVRNGGEDDSWTWQGERALASPPSQGLTLGSTRPDGSGLTTLGTIELVSGELILETNSESRAARGRELVETALVTLLGAPQVKHKPLAELIAERRENPEPPPAPSPISPEDETRVHREFKTRYYQEWLDSPVPALDGKTPREASQTEAGRAKVVALLKGLESLEERTARATGIPALDYGWLWRELGLTPS